MFPEIEPRGSKGGTLLFYLMRFHSWDAGVTAPSKINHHLSSLNGARTERVSVKGL